MTAILKVDTIQDTSGNNIINESSNTITIGASGDTVTVPSGATINLSNATQTGVGGTNTPAFEAKRSGTQSITNDTNVKIACNSEDFDTAGAYDASTNYRFQPQTAGKYYIYGQAVAQIAVQQLKRYSLFIRKNGSDHKYMSNYFTDNEAFINNIYVASVIDFNGSSDYVELWCKIERDSSGSPIIDGGSPGPTFGGYKLIGV